jgi:hypothetical protein
LRQINWLTVDKDKRSFLRITITLAHDLSAIVHRSGITALLKSVQCAQVSQRTAAENEGVGRAVTSFAVTNDHSTLVNTQGFAVGAP